MWQDGTIPTKKGPTGKHKDAERILFISGLSACYDHRSTIVGMSASPFHDQRAEPIIAAHRYGNMARAGQSTAREPTPSFRFRVGAFSLALTHTQVYAKRMEKDVWIEDFPSAGCGKRVESGPIRSQFGNNKLSIPFDLLELQSLIRWNRGWHGFGKWILVTRGVLFCLG